MKLTKDTVATVGLPPGKRDWFYWDDELSRFALRVRLKASSALDKTWIIQWKDGRKTKRLRIDSADVLDPKPARALARKLFGRIANGEDPSTDKKKRRDRDTRTMRVLVTEYLTDRDDDWADRTRDLVTRYLSDARYAGGLLSMPLDAIALADIASRITVIKRERGNPTAANWRSAASAFFVWCMRRGMCSANPVINSEVPETKPRERVLSFEEIAKIWAACADDDHGKIVRLLILLGARRQEIGAMAWPEFVLDAVAPSWTLPKERSKNGRAHTLPLLPMALAIIRSVPVLASRSFLFGERAEGFTIWSKAKIELDQRAGITEPFTVHDIRRSVATGMADIGVQPHIVECVLNHRSGHKAGIAGIYNRSNYPGEVRAALALWERFVALITDERDLYTKHRAFLMAGDEQAREKASEAFHDAIAGTAGHWQDYIRTLVEGGARKVLNFPLLEQHSA
jgi:integrase